MDTAICGSHVFVLGLLDLIFSPPLSLIEGRLKPLCGDPCMWDSGHYAWESGDFSGRKVEQSMKAAQRSFGVFLRERATELPKKASAKKEKKL